MGIKLTADPQLEKSLRRSTGNPEWPTELVYKILQKKEEKFGLVSCWMTMHINPGTGYSFL